MTTGTAVFAAREPTARGEEVDPDHPSQRTNPPPLHGDGEEQSRQSIRP